VRRYLVVDDNRQFAENLAEILREAGAEAEVALGGREALGRVAARRFDALVTDMRMPEMGGARLLHEVRRADPAMAAVVVTAHAGDVDLDTARREGVLGILPKPVPVDRLLDLLSAARRDGLVVVVEDDPALREALCEALRIRGFAAVAAGSVADTERLGALRPFCALVDLRVPGGADGEAMRRLAARFPELPMLVVTGLQAEAPLPHRALFTKPFDTGALLDTVERLHRERISP
jgi:DNA-binding NtrC family response regulator